MFATQVHLMPSAPITVKEDGDKKTYTNTDFTSTFAKLNEKRKSGEMCDVTINAKSEDGKDSKLVAHRVVLVASISFFEKQFSFEPEKNVSLFRFSFLLYISYFNSISKIKLNTS